MKARAFGVVFVLSIVAGSSARASNPDSTREASASVEEARRLFKAGDYARALTVLREVDARAPDPRLYWNMAACEKKLGHHARAIGLVERYVAGVGRALTDSERRDAEAFLVAARTLVASVTITSPVDGVVVTLDGEGVGSTPLPRPIWVDPGEHRVTFRRDGYRNGARTESVTAGGSARWTLEPEAEKHEGRIVVNVGADESVWLDGVRVGQGEWGGPVASGAHTVLVTGKSKSSRQRTITVRDDELVTVDLQAPSETRGTTWLWVGGGVLVAAGAAFGGYLLLKPSSPAAAEPPRGTLGTFTFP